MLKSRHSLAARLLSIVLMIATTYLGSGSAWAAKRPAPRPVPQTTVLVFPVDRSVANLPTKLGRDMAEAIKSAISNVPGYMGMLFSEMLPPVKRSLDEGSLRKTDVTGPFAAEKSAAGRIAKELRADLYIVGNIEDFNIDPSTRLAQMTVSADLVNAETGDVVKKTIVTGKSPEGKSGATDSDLQALAAGNAVIRLVTELLPGAHNLPEQMIQPAPQAAEKPAVHGARPAIVPKRMVLVFPLDKVAPDAPADFGSSVAETLKTSLSLAEGYMAVVFSERLPSVTRMLQEGTIKKTDLTGPFSDSALVGRLAKEVGADMHLVGSVEEYKLDTKARKAEVGLSIQIFDTGTGKPLKTLAVTGQSPAGAEGVSDRELVSLASANAVASAVQGIAPGAPVQVITDYGVIPGMRAKRKPSTLRMILLGLAIAGGIALASSGGGGAPTGPDVPPPPQY